MAAIVYPSTLPAPRAWGGLPADRARRSTLPGNTMLRAASRDALQEIDASWVYNAAEMAAWVAWYTDTLLDGMRWFAITAPGRGGWVQRVCRFRTSTVRRESMGAGKFRVSAKLQQRGISGAPALGPQTVNISSATDVGSTSGDGLAVNGFDPSVVYELSLPSGGLYTAWSAYASDGEAPGGLAWRNNFYVTKLGGGGVGDPLTSEYGGGVYVNAETARLAFPGGTLTGSTQYTFWMYDNNPSDNRGGLSILLTPI